ncbi:2422_t:CDS:2, partial [Funneliformis mosseae]
SNLSDTKRPVSFALPATLERLNEPLTKQQSFIATNVVLALQANARQEDYDRRPKSLLDLEIIKKLASKDEKITQFVRLLSVSLDVLLKKYTWTDFIDEFNCPHCSLVETLATIENALEGSKWMPNNKENGLKLEDD